MEDIVRRAKEKDDTLSIILIITILASAISIAFIFYVIQKVYNLRSEVSGLFTDIPKKIIKQIQNKCQKILTLLQDDWDNCTNDSDVSSNSDEDSQNLELIENPEVNSRKRKGRFLKGNLISQKKTCLQSFLIICCIQSYFIQNYITSIEIFKQIDDLALEFQLTSLSDANYYLSVNLLRETISTDGQLPLLNKDAFSITSSIILDNYRLNNKLLELHLSNRDVHTNKYMDQFDEIMHEDVCLQIDLNLINSSLNECHSFADGVLVNGLLIGFGRFFETQRVLLSGYSKVVGNRTAINELLNSWQLAEVIDMQDKYNDQALLSLRHDIEQGIKDRFNILEGIKQIIFIVFMISLLFFYVVL